MNTVEKLIEHYHLQPHPEGGYFSEIYRAANRIPGELLPQMFDTPRNTATSIYFLLKSNQKSQFHQLLSDEIWYYHTGDPIILHLFHPNGQYSTQVLGPSFENNELFQIVIPQKTIFGAESLSNIGYSFVGCMVSPGFDFADFKLIRKWSTNLYSIYGLNDGTVSAFGDASYLIAPTWRLGVLNTFQRFQAGNFSDAEFTLSRALGRQAVTLAYSKSRKKFRLEMNAVSF